MQSVSDFPNKIFPISLLCKIYWDKEMKICMDNQYIFVEIPHIIKVVPNWPKVGKAFEI